MKEKKHIIQSVTPGSIAEELELEAGDAVLAVNDSEIEDIFDYQFLTQDSYIELLVEKKDKEEWLLEIDKDPDEDLGIQFENGLMDEYRSCRNKCVFCFIDQMPPGMRDTLYFKDDDSRLSFLQGNYVTLTNMSDHDIERIIKYHLGPINVSVQTTNPELRCEMLHNRFAGEALKKMEKLHRAGIEMNGQVVLCAGLNDGEELDRTIRDLGRFCPVMQSMSVVPVGLTKYRDGLYPLRPIEKEDAERAIDQIERWQKIFYEKYGFHFVHASDEFYVLAGRTLPEEERYDGYIQLENGVGMLRLLIEEVTEAYKNAKGDLRQREISIATGKLPYPFLRELTDLICEKFPNIRVHMYPVTNYFFGEKITVSGLITGQDLIGQLTGQPLGQELLLPVNMFRSGENVFLDDLTLEDAQRALQVPVNIVKSSGQDFFNAVVGEEKDGEETSWQRYEIR